MNRHNPEQIVTTFPGEYRVLQDMMQWERDLSIPLEIRDDNRFLCTPEAFRNWAAGRKNLRMEFFYREMRRKYNLLMNGDKPEGGQWNFDSENRKPPRAGLQIPATYSGRIDNITQSCIELVDKIFLIISVTCNHFVLQSHASKRSLPCVNLLMNG